MMRRRKGELTVFSIATLDVFASAMGVFMLIAVVLFPYYMKNVDAIAARDTARAQMAAARAASAEAQAAAAAAIVAAQSAQDDVQRANREAAELERRARAAESQLRQTFLLVLINWDTTDDVDLHLRDPSGAWFSWERPRIPGRPGELSEDVLRGPGNEVWQVDSASPGRYFICVNRFHSRTTGGVRVRGNVYHQDGRIALNEVTLTRGGTSRTLPMAVIVVDDDGKVRLQPASQATCPQFRLVEYDPKD
jgi:hypothetical protein